MRLRRRDVMWSDAPWREERLRLGKQTDESVSYGRKLLGYCLGGRREEGLQYPALPTSLR